VAQSLLDDIELDAPVRLLGVGLGSLTPDDADSEGLNERLVAPEPLTLDLGC